ncbi:MAG: hypothetical protein ACREEJ_11590 [Ensifer adhaerens]|uniref:Uncharacterized protein n=1 Tax=Ensifer adhaerens TaxID=106592 RepID=A0A0L8BL39_ENSAD|nr:hypothetical protein [Ensifer adhaerens]KOF15310.1 hypothetical protein AC244_23645 [Ensifer adhaerens]
MNEEPKIVLSPLSQEFSRDGITVTVEISRIEDGSEWALEVIDTQGMSTRWEDLFPTDAAALAEFLSAVEQDGMSVFVMPSALH